MKFLSVQEPAFVMLSDLYFWVFLTPCTWGARGGRGGAVTFSFLIRFGRLLLCQMRQEVSKFCLDIRKNGGLTLGPACPERLSVRSSISLLYTSGDLRKFLRFWMWLIFLKKSSKNGQKIPKNHKINLCGFISIFGLIFFCKKTQKLQN